MFSSFISLGSNCRTASALSKYGLRSFSGPFDWCISDFMKGVIPLLESDFEDFLSCENLRISEENDKVFDDIKYKIKFNHDVNRSLEEEYESIKEKYQRRIERFRQACKQSVCFVCTILNMESLRTIAENEDRIERAISFLGGRK